MRASANETALAEHRECTHCSSAECDITCISCMYTERRRSVFRPALALRSAVIEWSCYEYMSIFFLRSFVRLVHACDDPSTARTVYYT